jgi:hypothetical protein
MEDLGVVTMSGMAANTPAHCSHASGHLIREEQPPRHQWKSLIKY